MFCYQDLIIKSTSVFNLFLIRQRLGHVIVPALRTVRSKVKQTSPRKAKPPYDMVGEVGQGRLLITSPVRTSHLRQDPMIWNYSQTVLKTWRKPQRSSWPWIEFMSHRSGQPASRQSQGCCIRCIIVAATCIMTRVFLPWIEFWVFWKWTWLTQLVMVTLQVGQTSTLSLHLLQITWPLLQHGTGGARGMEKHTGHSTLSCNSFRNLSDSNLWVTISRSLSLRVAWRLARLTPCWSRAWLEEGSSCTELLELLPSPG